MTNPPAARAPGSPARPRRPKVTSLATQVATLIEEQCIASGLRPGDQLPSEGSLAEEFGVSRIVVREAMRSVEARGLIRRQQGKRAVVEEPNARPIEDYVTRSAQMDKHNIIELTEVRKALEVHGARLAARRMRAGGADCADLLTQAEALIDEMHSCAPDPAPRAELDVAFHHLLADLSGNVILAQMLAALDRPLHESREENHRASIRSGAPRDLWAEEHRDVLDAIRSGDPARAVGAMEAHLDLSLLEVQSRPDAPGRKGSAPRAGRVSQSKGRG